MACTRESLGVDRTSEAWVEKRSARTVLNLEGIQLSESLSHLPPLASSITMHLSLAAVFVAADWALFALGEDDSLLRSRAVVTYSK